MPELISPARPRSRGRRWRRRLGLAAFVLALLFYGLWVYPFWGFPFNASRHGRVPMTPAWALECWLWEDDVNTAEAVRELLDGYARHDIPVRTVLIDSPWSTRYNDFTLDTRRYPASFFGSLQTNGYRVVLWMTSMVNSRSKDTSQPESADWFQHARTNGFLAADGREVRWWKGRGGFLDYSNPGALEWWHGLQRQVLDLGIDGWKLDGTDTLFSGPGYIPWARTHAGWMSTRQYMDAYNREEYRHGLSLNPEFIVLTRAIDHRYFPLSHPEGFAPLDAAPVTWIGDRTHEWSSGKSGDAAAADAMRSSGSILDRGFEGALRDILLSAQKGYCVVGADVAGYHGAEPIPPRLYIRWAQFAAFTGLFLNGGHGERRLWKRSAQELEIIRRYAWLHTELVPYLHTLVFECHRGGLPMIRPVPGPYHFQLGPDLLVAPIHRDSPTQQVVLPPGKWRHLFDDAAPLDGGSRSNRVFELDDYPVYVREGAALPLNVSRGYTGFGDTNSTGLLTWAIWPYGRARHTAVLPQTMAEATLDVRQRPDELVLDVGPNTPGHVLRVHQTQKPSSVERDGRPVPEGFGWSYDAGRQKLWIRSTVPGEAGYRVKAFQFRTRD